MKTKQTSDCFKKVGNETVVNGKKVVVIDYKTAKQQVEAGLAKKTTGTPVLYVLSIDGTRTELRGKQFASWCEKNGISIDGKTGAHGPKRSLLERLEGLLEKEVAPEEETLKKAIGVALNDYKKAEAQKAEAQKAKDFKKMEALFRKVVAKKATKEERAEWQKLSDKYED